VLLLRTLSGLVAQLEFLRYFLSLLLVDLAMQLEYFRGGVAVDFFAQEVG